MSNEPPTLDEIVKGLTDFGAVWVNAQQSYCDKIAEAFSHMQFKPVEFPIRDETRPAEKETQAA